MKRECLKDILDRIPSIQREGEAYRLGPAVDATVFAQAGGEAVTVPRVERVELRAEYVALQGTRGEMLFFPYELVAGLKIEPRATGASGATSKTPPGFGAR